MRIVAGKYRGRHFDVPRSFKARPTTDFAKENIFNVLRSYIDFEGEGVIKHLRVSLDITHPYRRDLAVTLYSPCYWDGGEDECAIELYDGKSDPDRNAADLKQTFDSDALNGKIYEGDWILRVADDTKGEEGVLNSWSLEVVTE